MRERALIPCRSLSTTALDRQRTAPYRTEVDSEGTQDGFALLRMEVPCFGVSAPVVADLVAGLRQAAPPVTRRHVVAQLGLDRAADLLERESGPPFFADSRSFCSARNRRLTDVSIKWRRKPT